MGLRSEKGCAGDAQQKLKTTDPTSRQRGRPSSTNPQLSLKISKERRGKNWLRVPNECLTSRQTGQLKVGRNITLTLTIEVNLCEGRLEYLDCSPASRLRRQKGNTVPEGIAGHLIPGGYKYQPGPPGWGRLR
jgi:hypothetical protein